MHHKFSSLWGVFFEGDQQQNWLKTCFAAAVLLLTKKSQNDKVPW